MQQPGGGQHDAVAQQAAGKQQAVGAQQPEGTPHDVFPVSVDAVGMILLPFDVFGATDLQPRPTEQTGETEKRRK